MEQSLIDEDKAKCLLDKTKRIEAQMNNGRGVQCAKSAISFIEQGRFEMAWRTVEWDHDKLRNYPALQLVFAQMFPSYLEWLKRPAEVLDKLAEHLAAEELSDLTVVRMAQIDLEAGRLGCAISRLKVDADKIRMSDRWLYDILVLS